MVGAGGMAALAASASLVEAYVKSGSGAGGTAAAGLLLLGPSARGSGGGPSAKLAAAFSSRLAEGAAAHGRHASQPLPGSSGAARLLEGSWAPPLRRPPPLGYGAKEAPLSARLPHDGRPLFEAALQGPGGRRGRRLGPPEALLGSGQRPPSSARGSRAGGSSASSAASSVAGDGFCCGGQTGSTVSGGGGSAGSGSSSSYSQCSSARQRRIYAAGCTPPVGGSLASGSSSRAEGACREAGGDSTASGVGTGGFGKWPERRSCCGSALSHATTPSWRSRSFPPRLHGAAATMLARAEPGSASAAARRLPELPMEVRWAAQGLRAGGAAPSELRHLNDADSEVCEANAMLVESFLNVKRRQAQEEFPEPEWSGC
mmetsp:Transcript_91489/g.296080  ORF Transcript_91489/g.296080 Transcript_91489/m.296080 type:complete len:373 (+) Transcript_91489:71-1189(+)